MKKKSAERLLPRARLTDDRRTGGAHRVKRELSAREDLTMRLNELAQEDLEDPDDFRQQLMATFSNYDEEDYYDDLLERYERMN